MKDTLKAIHAYWRDPEPKNAPEQYAADTPVLSELLLTLLSRHVPPESAILELGCNCGRNLNYIYERGFRHLAGIDINAHALAFMRKQYPNLMAVNTLCGTIEDLIRTMPDNSFDCIYTVAVLEHVHTDSEWIFAEMVRVAKRFIITIEDETGDSWRHFPRSYQDVFTGLGCREMQAVTRDPQQPTGDKRLDVFAARVFEKVQ